MNEYVNRVASHMQKEAERQARVRKFLREQTAIEGDPVLAGLTGAEYAAYGQDHEDIP